VLPLLTARTGIMDDERIVELDTDPHGTLGCVACCVDQGGACSNAPRQRVAEVCGEILGEQGLPDLSASGAMGR
jgi:hypothetical protein